MKTGSEGRVRSRAGYRAGYRVGSVGSEFKSIFCAVEPVDLNSKEVKF